MRTFLFETSKGEILEFPANNLEQAENRVKALKIEAKYKAYKRKTVPFYADWEDTKSKRHRSIKN
ncbi:hypothetical protein V6R21_11635 [Limibacter armeniacum]|uniref:hypothetical protein n=1 Tax=Limibacter armeniacum TaxID=466084 RepID=UPI002FE5F601